MDQPETGSQNRQRAIAEPRYDVVWPGSPMGVPARRSAERLDDLAGAKVAFLWDNLFRGDELFPVLDKELTTRFPSVEILSYEVFGNTHGADEVERIERLPADLQALGVEAVVSGMGC